MMMKRLRTVITDRKLTMHPLRHRMNDKLRNMGCPEAISIAILRHSSNTVVANLARATPSGSCGSTWRVCGVKSLNSKQQQTVLRIKSFSPTLKHFFPTYFNQFINQIFNIDGGELCLNFGVINQLASNTK